MGLLDWFKEKPKKEEQVEEKNGETPIKESFVEEKEVNDTIVTQNLKGLQSVYAFTNKEYHDDGYYDALQNQNIENRDVNVNALVLRLTSLIDQAEFYYETAIIDIDRRIDSAKRMGLTDLVDSLESEKIQVRKAIERLNKITSDIDKKEGLYLLVTNSYIKGFHKGVVEVSGNFTTRIKQ
ncbi:MAG: hypothetical protein H8E84_06485 [Flavobacteriales bacterium]|nr:hypothetical protein [Flavobacteriales bacterium]